MGGEVGGTEALVVGGTVALVVGGTVARVVVVGGRVVGKVVRVVFVPLAADLATVVVVGLAFFFGFPATEPMMRRTTKAIINHTHHR